MSAPESSKATPLYSVTFHRSQTVSSLLGEAFSGASERWAAVCSMTLSVRRRNAPIDLTAAAEFRWRDEHIGRLECFGINCFRPVVLQR